MKVLFDATWIVRSYGENVMHGGLRLAYELAKRLASSDLCEAYFTTTLLEYLFKQKLEQFLQTDCQANDDRIILNYPTILKIDDKVRKLTGLSRGRGFVKRIFGVEFINEQLLQGVKVYHSPVEPIPDIIKKNKKIRPFFTSLDLLPFVRPDVSPKGFAEGLKIFYDSIDERTIVLAISESTKNDLLNLRKDINPENVVVSYIGADTKVFYPKKSEVELKRIKEKFNIKHDKYFLVLNRLQKYKNTEHTLKCFDTVTRSGELKDIGLLVVDSSYDENSKIIFEKYGQNPNIQFIEYVPDSDLAALFSNVVCFFYMSLYEGFGLPILEAMQCGAPVVCSNTSSMPEVIGDCGITLDPSDETELCQTMISIAGDEKLRCLLSQKGIERAKLFSWDNYTNEVINAYKKFQYN